MAKCDKLTETATKHMKGTRKSIDDKLEAAKKKAMLKIMRAKK